MKADWDKLADAYADSPNVVIADVDCTAAGEQICNKVGIEGFPTIRYFLPDAAKGKDYQGGRSYAALNSFVEKTFKPPCDVATSENCNDNQKALIEEFKGKSTEEYETLARAAFEEQESKRKAREAFIDEGKVKIKAMKAEEL